jgi:hypothetical protein
MIEHENNDPADEGKGLSLKKSSAFGHVTVSLYEQVIHNP